MPNISADLIDEGHLKGYKKCEKCNAPFERLYVGGDGDWRQTIMCEVCFHVRRAIPLKIIWELLAHQYEEIGTPERAKVVDEKAQAAYQAVLAKYAVSPTTILGDEG